MRLTDKSEKSVPGDVRADLDAVDAILEGGSPEAGMEELALLTQELRAMRPEEDADFASALDQWAAAGFPHEMRPGTGPPDPGGPGPGAWFASLIRPRRLAPMGMVVAGAVVAVVAVSQVGDLGGDEGSGTTADGEVIATQADGGADTDAAAEAARENSGLGVGRDRRTSNAPAGSLLFSDQAAAESNAEAFTQLDRSGAGSFPRLPGSTRPGFDPSKGPAGGEDVRKVERDADLILSAQPDEVQDVTNEAIDVVRGHRGIVLNSQSTIGTDSSRATLQLAIPTKTLDTAIGDLSDLADVKSLSEGSLDITRAFVDAKDKLAGLRAERQGVIAALKVADTEAELDQLRVRLARIQRDVARAESEFNTFQRRARLSNVTVQITSEGAADNSDWSFGDAIDDAGRVLTVAAGVALISAAVLVPLALIAALAFLLAGRARNHSRERALDDE